GAFDVIGDDRWGVAYRGAEQQHLAVFDQGFRRLRIDMARIGTEYLQTHALLEEAPQPASVGALAADQADVWGCVLRAHGRDRVSAIFANSSRMARVGCS